MSPWSSATAASVTAGIATAVLLALTLSLPAGAAEGQDAETIGVRLADVPSAQADDPRARMYVVDHLAPGTQIVRRIEVSSTSDVPTEVDLYSAGATVEDGQFVVAADRSADDLSSWTTVSPARLVLPALGSADATVTIAVPTDAPPGEHYAVAWAQVTALPSTPGGIALVSRVGVRLYVSVGPGGAPAADFAIEALTAGRSSDGRPFILATVRNTGGRALDLSGTLTLADGPGGLTAGPFPTDQGVTLGIGETEPVTVSLDDRLPSGPWNAQITMSSGLVERHASAEVTFPATGLAPTMPTDDGSPPWAAVIVAGAAVLTLAAGATRLRAARRRTPSTVGR